MFRLWTRPTTKKKPLFKLASCFFNINFNIFTFTSVSSISIVSSCWSIETLYTFLLALMRAKFFYFPIPWFGRPNDISQTQFLLYSFRELCCPKANIWPFCLFFKWSITGIMAKHAGTFYLLRFLLQSEAVQKKIRLFLSVNSVSNNYSFWDYQLPIDVEISSFLPPSCS